jgi:hypothetical protein
VSNRAELAAENLALRQQVVVLQRGGKRAKITRRVRIFWVGLSRVWRKWRSALAIVQPSTVVKWHRQGFKLYWRWRSEQRKVGRPKTDVETRQLIRRECLDHVIILNERHLYRILREYVEYYNESRAHLSLDGNSPVPREVEPPSSGTVVAVPYLGGLHHRYTRAA